MYTDFPVKSYKGTKSIVISTVSWVGGKNPFLGWAYVAAAALFVLLAVLGTIRHLLKPRYACPIALAKYRVLISNPDAWATCRCSLGTGEGSVYGERGGLRIA
jgi:hypothetical protein